MFQAISTSATKIPCDSSIGLTFLFAPIVFIIAFPSAFLVWYYSMMTSVLLSRIWHFFTIDYQYFLLDFCYFNIFLTFLSFAFDNVFLQKSTFLLSVGIQSFAILIWKNGFDFTDWDQICSVCIHLFPCIRYYFAKWIDTNSSVSGGNLSITDFFFATFIYGVWQGLYLLKTEVLDRQYLDKNQNLQTSLRWLVRDTDNKFCRFLLQGLRWLGLYGEKEEFNATSVKTKTVFVVGQFLLTIVSFLPAYCCFKSRWIHWMWILTIALSAIHEGLH